MAYRDLPKRLDPELPKLFRTLPRLPYGIRPVPEFSEKTVPAGYYSLRRAGPGRIEKQKPRGTSRVPRGCLPCGTVTTANSCRR